MKRNKKKTEEVGVRRRCLHAPWRLDYILGPKESACFFCTAAQLPKREEILWREKLLLARNRHVLVVMNRYPYTGGHLLVAPLKHTADYAGLSTQTSQAIWRASQICVSILAKRMKPDGFNVGMNLGRAAGAGVEDHLHLHVLPRWSGDTNFLPIIGGTHSLPIALEKLWDVLRHDFQNRFANL